MELGLEHERFFKRWADFFELVSFFQRFDKNLKLNSSLSAQKMKTHLITCNCVVLVFGLQACQERTWRSHIIKSCGNGSAINNANGKWIWIEQRPIICGSLERPLSRSQLSSLSLVAIIRGTMACIACHCYYAVACFWYRVIRQLC